MAILSSVNVLYFRVAFLLTLAFLSYKDVTIILTNSYFLLFTQAMRLPQLVISQYSAQLGLVGLLFMLLALSDFIPLLEDNRMYFYSMVPVRLLVYFIIVGLAYFWESNYYLHNNAVFLYGLCEVWMNFIIYNSLREEREKLLREERMEVLDEEEEEKQQGRSGGSAAN